jgi:hypothetical protein
VGGRFARAVRQIIGQHIDHHESDHKDDTDPDFPTAMGVLQKMDRRMAGMSVIARLGALALNIVFFLAHFVGPISLPGDASGKQKSRRNRIPSIRDSVASAYSLTGLPASGGNTFYLVIRDFRFSGGLLIILNPPQ